MSLINKLEDLTVSVEPFVNIYDLKENDVVAGHTVIQFLAGGSSGRVYEVKKDGRKLAMKVVRLGNREAKYLDYEIEAMQQLRHQYILSSEMIFQYNDCVCFIMDKLKSDLDYAIAFDPVFNDPDLSEKMIRKWMAQLVEGIDFLHGRNFIHRDLDTSNILVDENKNIKIADFGFARSLPAGDGITPEVVSEQYNAPEMLFKGNYGYAVDMWSMGIIMANLANKVRPFDKDNLTEEVLNLLENDPTFNITEMCTILSVLGIPTESDWKGVSAMPSYPTRLAQRNVFPSLKAFDKSEALDEDGNNFLQRLLQIVPSKRLTITEARNHPYIRKYYGEESD